MWGYADDLGSRQRNNGVDLEVCPGEDGGTGSSGVADGNNVIDQDGGSGNAGFCRGGFG